MKLICISTIVRLHFYKRNLLCGLTGWGLELICSIFESVLNVLLILYWSEMRVLFSQTLRFNLAKSGRDYGYFLIILLKKSVVIAPPCWYLYCVMMDTLRTSDKLALQVEMY